MVTNIKKLRKYYLFKVYSKFLQQHDLVLFCNANGTEVRNTLLQEKLGCAISVLNCKNTLLQHWFAGYPELQNIFLGDMCLIGVSYTEDLEISSVEALYSILQKQEFLIFGGLYTDYSTPEQKIFYLPLDKTILPHHIHKVQKAWVLNKVVGYPRQTSLVSALQYHVCFVQQLSSMFRFLSYIQLRGMQEFITCGQGK